MDISDSRSYKIQMLRGVAIIAVVCIHNLPLGLFQIWLRPFVNFSVGMFLFLSGMLSKISNWNPQKRIKKIIIPYLIWTLFYVVLGNYTNLSILPITYIKNVFTGGAAAVMYYVFVYCELTLLIPVIDKLAKAKYKYLGFIVSPIEIIIMRLIPLIMGIKFNEYIVILMNVSCLGWFSFFYLGYLLGNGFIQVRLSNIKILCFCFVGFVLQIAEGYWYYHLGEVNCGTQLKLSSLFLNMFIILLAYRFIVSGDNKIIKWLRMVGDYSFGIFFSHLLIMQILNKIPYYINFAIFPINVVIVLVVSICSIILGKKLLGKYAWVFAL